MPHSPRARALAAEIRAARKHRGMSQGMLAEQLGWSIAKVSRIETAQRGLSVPDLAAILAVLRVRGKRREYLLTMAKELDHPAWWEAMGGLPPHVRAAIDAEQRASRITELSLSYVPGLLQIRSYSEAIFTGSGLTTREIDEAANVRQVRQGILHKASPVRFEAFLDESVLNRPVGGPSVAGEQLRNLVEQAGDPHVSVRVLPAALGAHIGLDGPFALIEFSHGIPNVLLESQNAGVLLDGPTDDSPFQAAITGLERAALEADESRELISSYAARFEEQAQVTTG